MKRLWSSFEREAAMLAITQYGLVGLGLLVIFVLWLIGYFR